jgi:methylenetetrahydrofolate reductase (NADPH)
MTLNEIYSQTNNKPVISYEVFPPKDDADGLKLQKLLEHLKILKKYNPALISLTYGAGGTTQNASLHIIEKIQKDLGLNIMPHFTCVCTSRKSVKEYLKSIENLGGKNILALRGDIPDGANTSHFDFKYANELVKFIKSETDLSIGVAGYPEGHIECESLEDDLKYLKNKVNAGADVIYTQLFFDNNKFFNFVDSARKKGINIPIIPGILSVTNYNQLTRMLSMARVTLPDAFMYKLEKFKDKPDDTKKLGIEFATFQCQQLIAEGVGGLHFYTLNSSFSISQILDNLRINI